MKTRNKLIGLLSLLFIVTLILACIGFAACGDESDEPDDSADFDKKTETKGLTYEWNSNDTYTVTGCEGEPSSIVIPAEHDGLPVAIIASGAFEGRSSLKSLTIGENITRIGNSAFADCTFLTEINYNATNVSDFSSTNYVFKNAGIDGIGISVTIGSNVEVIPEYLFCPSEFYGSISYSPRIASITIGESVASIGEAAFCNCRYLTELNYNATCADDLKSSNWTFVGAGMNSDGVTLTIGANVTRIPANMFYVDGLSNESMSSVYPEITAVIFEENSQCESIGSDAFYYCKSLTSMTLPGSLRDIGQYAFQASGLTDITLSYGIETIGNSAFYGCSSLTSITLPDSVTTIGNSAFDGCSSLTSITLPDSVTTIGNSAFYRCLSLTSVVIPDSVTSIGKYAFSCGDYDTSRLESLTIGEGVITIGDYAFAYCTALTDIHFNAVNMSNLADGNNVFYIYTGIGTSKKSVTLTIGANVTRIPAYLFCPVYNYIWDYSIAITTVVFEPGCKCTTFGSYAFYHGSNLKTVYYSGSSTDWSNITKGSGNSAITSATRYYYSEKMPTDNGNYWHYDEDTGNVVIWTEWNDGSTDYDEPVLDGSAGLQYTSVSGGYSVTGIGECTDTDIKIPSTYNGQSVVSIGERAFYNNTSLTSITIPDSVTSIGDYAFYGCSSLTSVTISSGMKSIGTWSFGFCSSMIDATIPDSVTSVGYAAFYQCASLENLDIGAGVVSIEEWAFGYCTSLTSLTIPSGVTSIGVRAFYGCSSLTSLTIPESVTSIGTAAFGGCSSLTKIEYNAKNAQIASSSSAGDPFIDAGKESTQLTLTIGANVESICSYMFAQSYITEVVFVEECVCSSIGDRAFISCTSLKSINIPSNVNSIAEFTFDDCSSLTTVTFDENSQCTSIGQYAFYNCISLTSIIIPASVTSIGNQVFRGCSSLTTVTFAAGSQCASIGQYAFYGCSSLTAITIPAATTSIDSCAFYNCTSLENLTVEDGNGSISIGEYAFYACSALTSVNLSDRVTSLGIYAFAYCSSLTAITIPSGIIEISEGAFSWCSGLTSAVIPESVTVINKWAFNDCTSLAAVYYFGTPEKWSAISFNESYGNYTLTQYATVYYYSERKPNFTDSYSYWHYVDGEPSVWNEYDDDIEIPNDGEDVPDAETAMTDADVEALVSAIENTLGYDGTYTLTSDASMYLSSELLLKLKYIYSYDEENSIEYSYDERMISYESEEETFVSESYIPSGDMSGDYYTRYYITDGEKTRGVATASNCFDSLYRSLNDYSYIDLSDFTSISSLTDLQNALLRYAYDLGYSYASSPTEIKMTVAGGVYTLSAIYDTGEVTLVITVENGCITGMNLFVVETDDGMITAVCNDVEISYDYDSTLAANFSDLSQWG